jgi:hypothetical protein
MTLKIILMSIFHFRNKNGNLNNSTIWACGLARGKIGGSNIHRKIAFVKRLTK